MNTAYRVMPYCSQNGGYPINFFYPLDSGQGEGSYLVARFVQEQEADHFAEFCNRMLDKFDTNDMDVWDWNYD